MIFSSLYYKKNMTYSMTDNDNVFEINEIIKINEINDDASKKKERDIAWGSVKQKKIILIVF